MFEMLGEYFDIKEYKHCPDIFIYLLWSFLPES